MKKFLAPVVLLVLASALAVYLLMDFSGSRNSFDADAYLTARSKIDSLEHALWNAKANPDQQVTIRLQLDSAWEVLSSMRVAPAMESADGASAESPSSTSDIVKCIVGGILAIGVCVAILVLVLRKRQEIITRRMEAIKAERFKEPKAILDDATIPPRPRREKRSIIADAEEYAAQKRETMAQAAAAKQSPSDENPKVEFEDENGVPENKILTGSPDGKPTLRPTAKERITSAMQNLSDVLRTPRGLSRERTMKLRAQSRNLTGDPNLQAKSPLEITRFDRESSEKNKILQMSRRGFPASAIASSLKISQEKVEAVIKEAMG
jgi:hypothetical protein